MKQWLLLRKFMQQHEQSIYLGLCIGIVYSLIFWTLLNSILCISLAGYWLFFGRKNTAAGNMRKTLVFVFISLYLVALAGLLNTANMKEGMTALQQKSALLLFPVIFGNASILPRRSTRIVLSQFLIATAICCTLGLFWGIINFSITGDFSTITRDSLILFPDIYPYIMGLFCLLSTIMAFYIIPDSSKQLKKLLFAAIALFSVFIILLSIRLVIACWLLTILYFTFRDYIQKLYWRLAIVASMLLLLVLSFTFIPSLQNQWKDLKDVTEVHTIQLDKDASLGQSWGGRAIRMAIWQCSMDLVHDHWLWGVGSGDVQDSLQMAYEKRQFYFASRYNRYNTHNQYLQSLIGNGVAGIASLLLCIIFPFAIYKKKRFPPAYYWFLLLFFAIGFTESILETNKGIVWYSLFNSIFAFSDSSDA